MGSIEDWHKDRRQVALISFFLSTHSCDLRKSNARIFLRSSQIRASAVMSIASGKQIANSSRARMVPLATLPVYIGSQWLSFCICCWILGRLILFAAHRIHDTDGLKNNMKNGQIDDYVPNFIFI